MCVKNINILYDVRCTSQGVYTGNVAIVDSKNTAIIVKQRLSLREHTR